MLIVLEERPTLDETRSAAPPPHAPDPAPGSSAPPAPRAAPAPGPRRLEQLAMALAIVVLALGSLLVPLLLRRLRRR